MTPFKHGDVVVWEASNGLAAYNGSLGVVDTHDNEGVHLLCWVVLNPALQQRLANSTRNWSLRNWRDEQWKKVGHLDGI